MEECPKCESIKRLAIDVENLLDQAERLGARISNTNKLPPHQWAQLGSILAAIRSRCSQPHSGKTTELQGQAVRQEIPSHLRPPFLDVKTTGITHANSTDASHNPHIDDAITSLVAAQIVEHTHATSPPSVSNKDLIHALDQPYVDDGIPAKAPVRNVLWGELLKSFMEKSNIRWVELVSATLIIVCSVGLVISLWSTLSQTSRFFPSLVFLLASLAIHGAGQYTLRKWKLRATSRAILHIGNLLIPLCVLVGLLVARREDLQLNLDLTAAALLVVGLLAYSGLSITACRALFRDLWWPVAIPTIVSSITLIPALLLSPNAIQAAFNWCLTPLAILTVIVAFHVSQTSRRKIHLSRQAYRRVSGTIVHNLFASGVAVFSWIRILTQSTSDWQPCVPLLCAVGSAWGLWGALVSFHNLRMPGMPQRQSKSRFYASLISLVGMCLAIVAILLNIAALVELSDHLWLTALLLALAAILSLVWGWSFDEPILQHLGLALVLGTLIVVSNSWIDGLNVLSPLNWLRFDRNLVLLGVGIGAFLSAALLVAAASKNKSPFLQKLHILVQELMVCGAVILIVASVLAMVASFTAEGQASYGRWSVGLMVTYGLMALLGVFVWERIDRNKLLVMRLPLNRLGCSAAVMTLGQVLLACAAIRYASFQSGQEILSALAIRNVAPWWSTLGLIFCGTAFAWRAAGNGELIRARNLGCSGLELRENWFWLLLGGCLLSIISHATWWLYLPNVSYLAAWGWMLAMSCTFVWLTSRQSGWRELAVMFWIVWIAFWAGEYFHSHLWWQEMHIAPELATIGVVVLIGLAGIHALLVKLSVNWKLSWLVAGPQISTGLILYGSALAVGAVLTPPALHNWQICLSGGSQTSSGARFASLTTAEYVLLLIYICLMASSQLWIANRNSSLSLKRLSVSIILLPTVLVPVYVQPPYSVTAVLGFLATSLFILQFFGRAIKSEHQGDGPQSPLFKLGDVSSWQFEWNMDFVARSISNGLLLLGTTVVLVSVWSQHIGIESQVAIASQVNSESVDVILVAVVPGFVWWTWAWLCSLRREDELDQSLRLSIGIALLGAISLALRNDNVHGQFMFFVRSVAYLSAFFIGLSMIARTVSFVLTRIHGQANRHRIMQLQRASSDYLVVAAAACAGLYATVLATVVLFIRSPSPFYFESQLQWLSLVVIGLTSFWVSLSSRSVTAILRVVTVTGIASTPIVVALTFDDALAGSSMLRGGIAGRTMLASWIGLSLLESVLQFFDEVVRRSQKESVRRRWLHMGSWESQFKLLWLAILTAFVMLQFRMDVTQWTTSVEIWCLIATMLIRGLSMTQPWLTVVAVLLGIIAIPWETGFNPITNWEWMFGPLLVALIQNGTKRTIGQLIGKSDNQLMIGPRPPVAGPGTWVKSLLQQVNVEEVIVVLAALIICGLTALFVLLTSALPLARSWEPDLSHWRNPLAALTALGLSLYLVWDKRLVFPGWGVYLSLLAVAGSAANFVCHLESSLRPHAWLVYSSAMAWIMAFAAVAIYEFSRHSMGWVSLLRLPQNRELLLTNKLPNFVVALHVGAACVWALEGILGTLLGDEYMWRSVAALLPIVSAISILPFAGRAQTGLRYWGISLVSCSLVLAWWCDLPLPITDFDVWLYWQRTFSALAFLCIAFPLVGHWLGNSNGWGRSLSIAGYTTGALSILCGGIVLLGETASPWASIANDVALTSKFLTILSWSLLGGRALQFAVYPIRVDYLVDGTPPSVLNRKYSVYIFQVVIFCLSSATYFHFSNIFQNVLVRWWPIVFLAIAMLSTGIGELLRRYGQEVIAEPVLRTSLLLPAIPLLSTWWIAAGGWNDPVQYSGLLISSAAIYFAHGWLFGAAWLKGCSMLLSTLAFWFFLSGWHDLSFTAHPQLWLVPPVLVMLAFVEWNHLRLHAQVVAASRYILLLTCYLSSSVEMILSAFAAQLWQPIVLLALALLGMALGFVLRIRAFLYCGTTFVGVSLFGMVWHAQQAIDQVWPWWAFGIFSGIIVFVLLGYFEKNRAQVISYLSALKQWEQ